MKHDLTQGTILKSILWFTGPLLIGNILQQCYNLVDTYIVGQALGANALAAVGSSYTLMTFIISIITGLCMGSATLVSFYYGNKDIKTLQKRMGSSFLIIGCIALFIQFICSYKIHFFLSLLNIPSSVYNGMNEYLYIIFQGIFFMFIYNYFAYMLRALGNSFIPLFFLSISTITNILLDIYFVYSLHSGIKGAALATVIAQIFSAVGIMIYCLTKENIFRIPVSYFKPTGIKEISFNSLGACIQQSIMNFGILMVQSLVNTFGASVMAAFAIGVKIDTLAYMPVQEFGNAFSTFVAQNYGANKTDRIHEGIRQSIKIITIFCICISLFVFVLSKNLISVFSNDNTVISVGSQYLRIEGILYIGIGFLFFFYGYFRAVKRPEVSILLTIISLGTRVLLSYCFASKIGYTIIWTSIPVGWILADCTGFFIFRKRMKMHDFLQLKCK